jgi:hypothetical protein
VRPLGGRTLDLVAMTIGALVIGKGLAAIDLVRNDRGGAAQAIPDRGAVISLSTIFYRRALQVIQPK